MLLSPNLSNWDLKTCFTTIMPECGVFLGLTTHTDTLHYYSYITIAVASLHSAALYSTTRFKFLCSVKRLPNVKMNRLLQEVTRGASGM